MSCNQSHVICLQISGVTSTGVPVGVPYHWARWWEELSGGSRCWFRLGWSWFLWFLAHPLLLAVPQPLAVSQLVILLGNWRWFYLVSWRSRAFLYFWGTRWLNTRLMSIPASSWEMDRVSSLPLLCCCRAKLRLAACSHRHSWVHKAFLLLKDIGKSDSRAPRRQVLPVPRTVLPSVSHPACPSPPSASSLRYFSSSSRLILQVTMFFLCNSKNKLFFF